MKKARYVLFGLFLLLVMPVGVFATPKMQCTYTGTVPSGDASNENIKVTITLGENNKFSISNPKLTTAIDENIVGCRQNDYISDCYQAVGGVEFKTSNVEVIEVIYGHYNLVTDGNVYTNFFVKDNKYTCPDSLTMLKHENADNYTYSFFLTSQAFSKDNCEYNEINDFSCQNYSTLTRTGPKIESAYDGKTINARPSSGNCCVYKYANSTVLYTYKFNSATGVASYAVCAGTNCMTSEPNQSAFAQYMSPSDNSQWSSYHDMSNCSNMPQNIWYSNVGGSKQFFPYHASTSETNGNTVFQATLQPNEYCESTLYSPNGVTNPDPDIDFGDPVEVNCEGILGDELIDFLNKIFRWIQILAPIFVIIISGIDFAGAILQDDKDAMKKASSKFIKRLIIAVALFFIPLILSWLLNIFNDISGAASSTCGIGE